MPVSALVLAAAASFTCLNPTHHDGDNLRCANIAGAMRLNGIDAPEMPGACRPGRDCVEGDPYAARDYLRSLTAGRALSCVEEDTDSYGRRIVNCTAGGQNISCAMIAGGHAVPRYAALDCNEQRAAMPAAREPVDAAPAWNDTSASAEPDTSAVGAALPLLAGMLALAAVNLITWMLFALDKQRAVAGHSRNRIPEKRLLFWSILGGSPAAWHAINHLRHKSSKDSFKQALLLISGLQAGAIIGGLWWWLAG